MAPSASRTGYAKYDEGVMLLTLRPKSPLSTVVECIWHHDGAAAVNAREYVLPDGRFHIVLNLASGKGSVSGLRSQYSVIDTTQIPWAMGVMFRTVGALAFLGASTLEFWNRSVALDLVCGQWATQILEQLHDAASPGDRLRILEAALRDRMRSGGKAVVHPAVDYAVQVFNDAPHSSTVAAVSREIGWSRRWFSHAFSEQVGMTPKRYCRLMRFRKVVRQIASNQPVDWADVALAGGFCDQAHLVHEFRVFSGFSPERYLVAERPFPNHVRTKQ
jgi:AraC-like DNA-binding protein